MSWPVTKLGDVCKLINGDRGKNYPSKDALFSEGIPFINAGNLKDDLSINCSGTNYITEERFELLSNGKVQEGDILFCLRGSLGKFAIVGSEISKGAIASSLVIIRPINQLDRNFLKNYLRSTLCKKEIERFENGAAQPNLSAKDLKDFKIPLPPLEEQKRIAAILDKADAIRRKRQQAIQLADEFLRAVFLDMFGDIPAKKSKYQFLGCRGYVSASSGKSSRDVFSEIPTEIPIYGGNGVNGYATRSLYDEPVIVLGRVGQQCAITNLTSGPAWVTDNAIVVQVTDSGKYNPVYLAYAFMYSPIRDTVTRLDLPFINQSMVLDAPIPLPPIELQNKFEKIREKTFQLIRGFTESTGKTQSCFSALSQKAFSGEL